MEDLSLPADLMTEFGNSQYFNGKNTICNEHKNYTITITPPINYQCSVSSISVQQAVVIIIIL